MTTAPSSPVVDPNSTPSASVELPHASWRSPLLIAPLQIPHRGDNSLVLLHQSNPLDLFLNPLLSPHPQSQRARTPAFLHRNGSPVIYSLLLLSTPPGSRSQRQLPVLLLNSQGAKAGFPLQFSLLVLSNVHPYQSHTQPVIQV